jgi:IstB-like ATP binding protein
VLTTNLPFADWGKVLDATPVATAVADRLGPNSAVLILGGTSYRSTLTEPPPRRTTAVKAVVPSPSRPPLPLCGRYSHDNKAPLRPHAALAYFSTADFGLLCDRW